jgi:hypothetical protein
MQSLPSRVVGVRSGAVDKFLLTDNTRPHVLLLSSKDKIPAIFNALSLRFAGRKAFVFGNVIKGEVAGVAKALNVEFDESAALDAQLPKLVVLEPLAEDVMRPAVRVFKGKYTLPDLDAFLRRFEQRQYDVPPLTLDEYRANKVAVVSPTDAAFIATECAAQRCVLLLVPTAVGEAGADGVAQVDVVSPESRLADASEAVRAWRRKYEQDPVAFALARVDELAGWRAAFGDARAVMLHLKRRRFAACGDVNLQSCSVTLVDRALSGSGTDQWQELPAGLQFLG